MKMFWQSAYQALSGQSRLLPWALTPPFPPVYIWQALPLLMTCLSLVYARLLRFDDFPRYHSC